MTDRELCIALNMISGIGFVKYQALREMFPEPDALRTASRGDLMQVDGIGKVLAERIVGFDWDAELSQELAIAERGGVRIITLADENYPEMLRELFDPPLVLYIRGKLPESFERSVAIVGSRRVSNYGQKMAEVFSEEAAAYGFTVVSGLAFGVDTIAHTAVVNAGGQTIGVLGGGLMHLHPKENLDLARAMVRGGGAIISEFPLNFPVARTNFPRRNRIVAALCKATVVIEAGLESGALITAGLAAEIGREVFAVPGRADNPQAQGCHKLIKDGAGLVENFGDVVTALCAGARPGDNDAASNDAVGSGELDADSSRVYEILKDGDADLEQLCEQTGMEVGKALAVLMKLEMKLLIERDAMHCYHLTGRKRSGLSDASDEPR